MDCCKVRKPKQYRLNSLLSRLLGNKSINESIGSCSKGKIVLIGNPNVGKSLIFNRLTGTYAVVSNYPGTTVEVSTGKAIFNSREFEIIDTPGMYSLLPISEEERVTRNYLLN